MAGAGGPIHRIDLASREITPLLRKNDPLLPPGRGYLYFPMSSRDGRLLAVGASGGRHDTFKADYEIFVLESDPQTLEPRAPAVRFTFDPALPLRHVSGQRERGVRIRSSGFVSLTSIR